MVAIESCLAQDCQPLEVIVLDDASTDGTAEVVRNAYPEVRLIRGEGQRGTAALKNIGLREAKGKFVFSIDDDAYYSHQGTISKALKIFQSAPRVAVVALAFVEPVRSISATDKRMKDGTDLRSFISCAYGVRKGIAQEVGGYRDFFFYRGEERDLSIRLLDRGYHIRFVDCSPVVHLFSKQRAWDQMFPLGIRNTFLFDWLNIPHPYALPRLLIDAAQLAFYKVSIAGLPTRFAQLFHGFVECSKYAGLRKPVSVRTYRLYRSLPRHGALQMPAQVPRPVCRPK